MQPTMTAEEAVKRVEDHIREAVARLPSYARLEIAHQTDTLPCGAPSDGDEPEGRIIVEHRYWIRGLPSGGYPRYFDTVQRYWEDRGYRQVRYEKQDPYREMVYTDAEEFRLRLATSGDGTRLTIRSQSPCIWPHGTPEPAAG